MDFNKWLEHNAENAYILRAKYRVETDNELCFELFKAGYENPCDAFYACEPFDLTELVWTANPSKSRSSYGTFLKAEDNGRYYKLSAGDRVTGIYGHESINECIVSDLLDSLGLRHTPYYGLTSDIMLGDKQLRTFVCWSKDFKQPGDSKVSFDSYYELLHHSDESVIDFAKRIDIWHQMEEFLVVDFLIINRDRHGANIELLKHADGSIETAPMFDHGLSLLAPLQNRSESVPGFDAMLDREANNFIGEYSLLDNLSYLTRSIKVNNITPSDIVSRYSKYLPKVYIDKITEIIEKRYHYLEEGGFICH